MNDKTNQLQTLVMLESQKMNVALKNYSDENHQLSEAQQQYQQLVDYRQDYHNQLTTASSKSMTALALQSTQQFIKQLDVAINEQQGKIRTLKESASQLFKLYLVAKQKLEAIEKMLETEKVRIQNEKKKQEQKVYDEVATGRWRQE